MSLVECYFSRKGGVLFGRAIQGLDALQDFGEAKLSIKALEASGAEQLEKIGAWESHELELLSKIGVFSIKRML